MVTTAAVPALEKSLVVSLRSLGVDEAYIERFLEDDPSALGLGDDVTVIDSQRRQDKGRLDLLLQDGAQEHRYEVELMLGTLDESHLIRTIEYWDIERRTYPAYEHCAVVVAEDITARFLNVITLFSGSIPIIALQVNAIKVGDRVGLSFLRVVDSRRLRRDDSIGAASPKTSDRATWISYAGAAILDVVDKCTSFINESAKRPRTLNYNKQFIGLMENGTANNFVHFSPNRSSTWINVNIDPADSWAKRVEDAGLEYRNDWALRVKVTPKSFSENEMLFKEMLQEAVAQDEKS